MKLSLVVPTYKKEKVVVKQLERVYAFLSRRKLDFELIVVIDGIIDGSKKAVEQLISQDKRKYSRIKLFAYKENQGKGYAFRYGLRKAKGDIVGFIDADLDIKLKTLELALNRIEKGDVDAVVPSKHLSGAKSISSPFRKILSFGLRAVNRMLIQLPSEVQDISCGLKLFKKETMDVILPDLKVNRFALDSEIFLYLTRYGFKIGVVPFYAKILPGSTSVKFYEIATMLKDIFKISIKVKLLDLKSFAENILFRVITLADFSA